MNAMHPRPLPPLRRCAWACIALAALAGCSTAPSAAPDNAPDNAAAAPPEAAPSPAPSASAEVSPPVAAASPSATASAPANTTTEPAPEPPLEQRFAAWLANFRASARAQGIDEATLRTAFDGVQHVPRVVELDRGQPEFLRTVWDYLDATVSAQRVTRGQDKLQQVRTQADDAAARYGVPPATLVAIWGIESNYGDNYGSTPTIDALATLGFDGRREAWARGQLMAALKILQNGDIARGQMIGSWAGAMGQTQFLPSAFLSYAVDADGDGRRDIWGSLADVMASTANFLARSGWQANQRWGAEVRLPPGFDLSRADAQMRLPTATWAADGVRTVDGTPLPDFADGAVLLPAGARGPAFLVGPNFRTILRYNNSINYALAVSLLSQRIAGGPAVLTPWPRDLPTLARSQLLEMQTALNARGFDAGTADGLLGPATRDALRRFQRSIGVPADGYPTVELWQRLQAP